MLGKRLRTAAVAAAVVVVLAGCNPLIVDQRGVHTDTSPQRITGHVEVPSGETLHQVKVNGVSAAVDGNSYSADVPLDGSTVFNPVLVEAVVGSRRLVERKTVVYADGEHATLADLDARIPNAGGLRVNDSALAKLAPAISAATPVDPAEVAPQDTTLFHFGCAQLPCPGSYVRAAVSGPPTIGGQAVEVGGEAFSLAGGVRLSDVQIPVHLTTKLGGGGVSQCDGSLTATELRATGGYLVGIDAANPDAVDVNLASALTGTVTGLTPSQVCLGGLVQTIPESLDEMRQVLEGSLVAGLADPDGDDPGDAPLADGIEAVLTGLTAHGPLADADGITVDSVHSAAHVDAGGLQLRQSTRYRADELAPGALDLAESLAWGDDVPLFADTTPGGLPFDYAVGTSTSSVDQLLAVQVERGFLTADIADPGGMESLARKPFRVALRPEVAPALRPDHPGPAAVGTLVLKGYRMTLIGLDDDIPLLEVVLDVDTTVELTQEDDGLVLELALPDPADVDVTVTYNPNDLPVASTQTTVAQAIPGIFAPLPRTLPAFPVPQIAGTQQQVVELARFGPNLVLYTNLVTASLE